MVGYSTSKRPILTLTVIAAATLLANRAVGQDGAYATAGAHMFGTSDTSADDGDELAVDVLGTSKATAGAAITKDALLEVGSDGKLVTKSTGKTVARALSAASADGDTFEILLLPANA